MYHRNETDETLVLLTLAGEQSAYEALVVRYQKAAVASAMAITKSHFMAEDAAQDAFVTAWMKLNTLRDAGKYGQWVCRIAKNCALNMLTRYRSFLPLDAVDNLNLADDRQLNPAELYALSEERKQISQSVEGLPEKVRKIIHLHYFEGLSIAEIADQMRISEGTVKWQLHDGRKRIRKELCAMNEKYTDTLVQRVMKKVEELKLWQLKNDKSGFETVYKDVLREVEELPECQDKQHALADVLARGWWWLPGEKNDALFARIADAAMAGKNEEVMAYIVAREDSRVYGSAKIEFIRDKQIPRLEKAGFVKTLAQEWLWLGYNCYREGKAEEGQAAYDKVMQLLQPGDLHYVLVPAARKMEQRLAEHYQGKQEKRFFVAAAAEECRYLDGKLHYWADDMAGHGWTCSVDREVMNIFRNSSRCDGRFFTDIAVGETFVGSDGTTLTFCSDGETVDTPAGRFENCQLWVIQRWTEGDGRETFKSYYQDGVGIVRHEHTCDGVTEARVLKACTIKGGKGLLPFAEGNTWEYVSEHDPQFVADGLSFTVAYADEKRVVLGVYKEVERLHYDENSWLDMIQKVRNEYFDGERVCDVYPAIARAEALAVTPMEKAHTKAAASVARRILATNEEFNPNYTAKGHWNFFDKTAVRQENGKYCTSHNYRWSFELKSMGWCKAEEPLLFGDILGILQDAANYIWSEEWQIGTAHTVEYIKWGYGIQTQIACEDGGTVTTKAGAFPNCLKLTMNITGWTDGLDYRNGKKVYYFADGIGIVRTENEYCDGAKTAVYELTAYEGVGEGFMPMADGLVRRYDALNLTDGYVGAVEYTYAADEEGNILIFKDQTGIRNKLPAITQYDTIENEVIEDRLWSEKKYDESRLRHDLNNFYLLCHFFARPNRNWCRQDKAAAWGKYRMQMMENLGTDGQVPRAWLGYYAMTCFTAGCATFACKRKEEGYELLEKAFSIVPLWETIPEGTELEIGDPLIYGDIKLIKGKEVLKLPDGTFEPVEYGSIFADELFDTMYRGMTAPRGWEWFNSVRKDDRFKELIDRVKELAEKYK